MDRSIEWEGVVEDNDRIGRGACGTQRVTDRLYCLLHPPVAVLKKRSAESDLTEDSTRVFCPPSCRSSPIRLLWLTLQAGIEGARVKRLDQSVARMPPRHGIDDRPRIRHDAQGQRMRNNRRSPGGRTGRHYCTPDRAQSDDLQAGETRQKAGRPSPPPSTQHTPDDEDHVPRITESRLPFVPVPMQGRARCVRATQDRRPSASSSSRPRPTPAR